MSGACAHCGAPLGTPAPADARYCCAGCAAAAAFVAELGLGGYYALRPPAPAPPAPADGEFDWDAPAFRRRHVAIDGDYASVTLDLEGLRCAACAWLVERALATIDGVDARVNASTARLSVRWRPGATSLGALVAVVRKLGYGVLPVGERSTDALRARRVELLRLAVAGIGAMQAMMFAEALYFGADTLDAATRDFLRWIGLLVATPVVCFAGLPFLRGARAEWRLRRPGMDTLVAGSALLAFVASVVETWRGGPAVYFDAAVMFVFLLLATRHVEAALRRRARGALERIARARPTLARRRRADGRVETVAADELARGDRVVVRADEVVPVDGVLASASGTFDEALLSGEGTPRRRRAGAVVRAGGVCLGRGVELVATHVGAESTLAWLARLVERAEAHRPRLARRADRAAAAFVVVLLAGAALTALAWSVLDPALALPATLAVLAGSCPCALSLALPAALAAAHARLARAGVLVVDPDALERLAAVDTVVFDKTGTLTQAQGRVRVVAARGVDAPTALGVAAALERDVPHPIARTFVAAAPDARAAHDVRVVAGQGVAGRVGGVEWRLGSASFAGVAGDAAVALRGGAATATFALEAPLRAGARAACAALSAAGCDVQILSGDAPQRVADVAARCGIATWSARNDPAAKLAAIARLQRGGRRVAMVGDGLNDAAVLARADVGVALGCGAALAQAHAAIVLLGDDPAALVDAVRVARRTRAIVRQNLGWAAAYNLVMIPLAAAGAVAPWAAAAGMCLSSLAVTLNGARLASARAGRAGPAAALREATV